MTIDDATAPGFDLAQLISGEAHAARNHVATLRVAQQLIDDEDVAADVRCAVDALQVLVERSVAVARIELGDAPASVSIAAAELVRLADRRARREGAPIGIEAPIGPSDVEVLVPGAWAERLLAEVVHVHAAGAAVELGAPRDGLLPITTLVHPDRWAAVEELARCIAGFCGAEIHVEADRVTIALPIA